MSDIRNVIIISGSPYVSIPKELGFKKGDSVIVEKIDEFSFKVTKVEWNKVTNSLSREKHVTT